MPPAQQQASELPEVFAGSLDAVARALAYTEKRIASTEARLMSVLQEQAQRQPAPSKGGAWGICLGVILLFLAIAAVVGCVRRGSAPSSMGQQVAPQMPMFVRAAGSTTPMVFSQAPPATFLQ